MKEFNTIEENIVTEIVEKKSKFIANLIYVETVEEAESAIKAIKKKYFDARHNCVAYRIVVDGNIIEKSSDDGEPSGTAGAPMLNILQKNDLANILIVVTRYFGGTLLGTGGLVRAYSECLQKAIENSSKITKVWGEELEVILDYNSFENFKYYCKNNNIYIIKIDYNENIVCKIQLEVEKKQKLMNDFETKKIILREIKYLSKKYIEKSI